MTRPYSQVIHEDYSVSGLFETGLLTGDCERIRTMTTERLVSRTAEYLERRLDVFFRTNASCCFVRFSPAHSRESRMTLGGSHSLAACSAGGWVLLPSSGDNDTYWLPQSPRLRRLDDLGHILEERTVDLTGISVSRNELALRVTIPHGWALDWIVWRLPQGTPSLVEELCSERPIEMQNYFLWGSHTAYQRPADVYLHLIHGHVYENRVSWPKYWKICSENDAHALYTVLSGLERASGKQLYRLLKDQLVVSVLDRQSRDGGWRHGEWSNRMESHYRLHCSAIHMLMDALQEREDPVVRKGLERAAAFLSRQTDKLDSGVWFLHDELEHSAGAMREGPFRWLPSRLLGKSESNMLVLNSHLDATVALDRYGEVTGDLQYQPLVLQAKAATRTVLALQPAESLYRLLFRAIGLTLLPSTVAAKLPLPMRAVKRITWKYLTPNLYRIKTRFPRLVMPGGYIDRSLSLKGWAFHYLSINIMDLLRYRRRFPGEDLAGIVESALHFTRMSGVLDRWRELRFEKYALGFWAESLYHACTLADEPRYREWLGHAVLLLEDQQMGLPPSLLGANPEAVAPRHQLPCPDPHDARLRVINLSRSQVREFMVVNATRADLAWGAPQLRSGPVSWESSTGRSVNGPAMLVPARGWIRGLGETRSHANGISGQAPAEAMKASAASD